ncbi:MAG TPA: AAA family ATPase [Phycisphaerales bacterium]|nr:AAA family ATPase [Phycisphaerales bacterium]
MTDQERIEHAVVRGRHPIVTIITQEEAHALELIQSACLGARTPLWTWTVTQGIADGVLEEGESIRDTENPAAALVYLSKHVDEACICTMLDLGEHLGDARTLRALRDTIESFHKRHSTLILIESADRLPPIICNQAIRIDLALPDEEELERLTRNTLRWLATREPIDARLSSRDLQTIIRNLRGLTRRQAEQVIITTATDDHRFDSADINSVLAEKRRLLQQGGVLEFVQTPVDLGEVGGLHNLKKWLEVRRDSLSDEARSFGLSPPRGILLLGVQGAGKSLSAKAIATAWQRPLLRLDPSALYDRYIGESERRLRETLQQAENMAPIILWIDEIEKGFASAASQSIDGGLSQRMFGTLLTWMQDHSAPVFLVATANDIEALPPELLRKGRFDEIFFVDLPTIDVRKEILRIHLQRRKRNPSGFDLAALAAACEGFSGAEIEQAIVSALHGAFANGTALDTQGILQSFAASPPLSVTAGEKVAMLRSWAVGRCVPAE